MKRSLSVLIVTALAVTTGSFFAQQAPAIQFDTNPMPLTMPDTIHLAEVAGIATNSRGDIYVNTRTGNTTITIGTSRAVPHGAARPPQLDRASHFVRQSAQAATALLQAPQ